MYTPTEPSTEVTSAENPTDLSSSDPTGTLGTTPGPENKSLPYCRHES